MDENDQVSGDYIISSGSPTLESRSMGLSGRLYMILSLPLSLESSISISMQFMLFWLNGPKEKPLISSSSGLEKQA